ncbi:unnamed protein product [Chrysoparadoxa australica]
MARRNSVIRRLPKKKKSTTVPEEGCQSTPQQCFEQNLASSDAAVEACQYVVTTCLAAIKALQTDTLAISHSATCVVDQLWSLVELDGMARADELSQPALAPPAVIAPDAEPVPPPIDAWARGVLRQVSSEECPALRPATAAGQRRPPAHASDPALKEPGKPQTCI